MARTVLAVASSLRCFVCAACLACADLAAAQTASTGVNMTGAINAGFNASGGTQSKTDLSGSFDLAIDGGMTGTDVRRRVRLQSEGLYGTSQAPGKAKTVGAEMYFVEVRVVGDLGELLDAERKVDADSGLWIYGVASLLHTIAFDLDAQRAIGVGVMLDVAGVPGLTVSADLRHLHERPTHQPNAIAARR
jgi:hypothetical protein